ncbi:Ig-like domain-containing protein [Myxococcus stipitatus]|uniref:Ig-like domain-containing protein n=1 Tax=Myxococcus stipitatus TaxID=83455 RepID=UPI001F2151E6|nr:Ig-like domain-containing protein [Myxococcus stipitatus]MCE9672139.1 Ig-like domain-containing protein [Myxococcus stipitatus]
MHFRSLLAALPVAGLSLACGPGPAGPAEAVGSSTTSQRLGALTALHDATLEAPVCATVGSSCTSGTLLAGRGTVGPEPSAPNTLHGSCTDGLSGTYHADESLDALTISSEDGTDLVPGKRVRIDARVWAFSSFGSDSLDLFSAADAHAPVWAHLATLKPTVGGSQVLSTTFTLPPGSLQAIRGVFRYGGAAAPCVSGSYNDHDDLVFATGVVVPDTTPPVTALTSPAAGGTLYATVVVTANASDDKGVTRVEFYADDTLVGTDTDAPYLVLWNTGGVPVGSHTLTARAFDAAGNAGTSEAVTVTVARDTTPPSVDCTAPAPGATVGGIVAIEATASDNAGVGRVDFYDGSTFIGSDNTAPYSVPWDTTLGIQGTHTLRCLAWDVGMNTGEDTVTVVTHNPQTVTYDVTLRTPLCYLGASACDTRSLLVGAANRGPELNAPNTLRGECADDAYGTFHYTHSVDRILLSTLDGSPLAEGKTVRAEVTVWASTNSPTGYADDRLDLFLASDYRTPVWTHLATLSPSASGSQKLGFTFVLPPGDVQVLRAGIRESYDTLAPCSSHPFTERDDLAFKVLPAVPDTVPPEVTLTAPSEGAVLRGQDAPLTASVSDDTRVSYVEFYADTLLLGRVDRAPFSVNWSTFYLENGPHTLRVKAFDSSGNSATASVNVVVDNDYTAPTVTLTSPASGNPYLGTSATFEVVANDDKGVVKVEYFVDSTLLGTSTTAPFSYTFDTLRLENGAHEVYARAFDAAGNNNISPRVYFRLNTWGHVAWDASLKVPACNYAHAYCDSHDLLLNRGAVELNGGPNTLNAACADTANPSNAAAVSLLGVRSTDGLLLTRGKSAIVEVDYYVPDASSFRVELFWSTSLAFPSWTRLATLTPTAAGGNHVQRTVTLPTNTTRMALRAVLSNTWDTAAACTTGDEVDHDDLVFTLK